MPSGSSTSRIWRLCFFFEAAGFVASTADTEVGFFDNRFVDVTETRRFERFSFFCVS